MGRFAILASLALLAACHSTPGPRSPEEAVRAYYAALDRSDVRTMQKLLSEDARQKDLDAVSSRAVILAEVALGAKKGYPFRHRILSLETHGSSVACLFELSNDGRPAGQGEQVFNVSGNRITYICSGSSNRRGQPQPPARPPSRASAQPSW